MEPNPIFDRVAAEHSNLRALRRKLADVGPDYPGDFPFANGHGPANAAVDYIDKHPEPVSPGRIVKALTLVNTPADVDPDEFPVRTGYVGRSGTYNVDSHGTIHANLGGDFTGYRARNRARYGDGNDAPEDRYRP